jgi:hypothetical protein
LINAPEELEDLGPVDAIGLTVVDFAPTPYRVLQLRVPAGVVRCAWMDGVSIRTNTTAATANWQAAKTNQEATALSYLHLVH